MYTLPQEIEVWYIIPAIRRELSKCLIKDHNITYEKVGQMLGISKAAVSQYLKNKRASKIILHPKVSSQVCTSCNKLAKGRTEAVKEITKILKFIRTKELHCQVCGEFIENEHRDCAEVKANYQED